MKQILFVLLIVSTFCYLVNAAAPREQTASTGEPVASTTPGNNQIRFKEDQMSFNIPISSTIKVINGTKLGEFLSAEFTRVIQEHNQLNNRQARDTDQQPRPYLIHGNLDAYPLN